MLQGVEGRGPPAPRGSQPCSSALALTWGKPCGPQDMGLAPALSHVCEASSPRGLYTLRD